MSQMRHDNLANALRLVASACSCRSVAVPRYRALAGKTGMVGCQSQCDIVAVLPVLKLGSRRRGCARVCEVVRCSDSQDSWVDSSEG